MNRLTTELYLHHGASWFREKLIVPYWVQAAMKEEMARNPEQWKNNEWALAEQLKRTLGRKMWEQGELQTIYLREGDLIGIAIDLTTEELALFNERGKQEKERWNNKPLELLETVRQELWEPRIGKENAVWSHRDERIME